MKKQLSIFGLVFMLFLAMIGTAFADPITVEDVKVEEVNGQYFALVTLLNADPSTGVLSELGFTIEELGTTSNEIVSLDTNNSEVFTFDLSDVVANYNLLKKGETYTLNVSSDFGSFSLDAFLFGNTVESDDGLGLIIEEIEVNSAEITRLETLQVLNGELLDVEIRFTATENFDDARMRISLDGYEHGVIDDSTDIFQVVEGKTYVKTLQVPLPADIDSEEDYILRIFGANDLSGITYKELTLYVDTQRHRVDVLDLIMTPSSGVEPGQNIIANVRLKNRGQKEQDSVKVSVEIPQLGVSESSYVSNLDKDESITSDDMLIFIPENAQAGQYAVYATLAYNDGYTETAEAFSITILAPQVVPEKNLLVSFKNNIDLGAGEERTFEVVVANPNEESKPISLTVQDNSWANVEVTPTLNMVQGGSSDVFTVTVTPKSSIDGERDLVLFVKDGADTISEVRVNTYVEGTEGISVINIVLAVLLIIAIIVLLALVVAIARRRGEEDRDDDVSTNEEYY